MVRGRAGMDWLPTVLGNPNRNRSAIGIIVLQIRFRSMKDLKNYNAIDLRQLASWAATNDHALHELYFHFCEETEQEPCIDASSASETNTVHLADFAKGMFDLAVTDPDTTRKIWRAHGLAVITPQELDSRN